jgi:hypothetical protein
MNDTTNSERSRVIARATLSDAMGIAPGFHSAQGFELLQREARAFMSSSMVPVTFRQWTPDRDSGQLVENPEALSNCVIALNMALRMHADPLMVMQNLYIVHGMPAWSAKFLIGLFNTCGRFSTIRYQFSDKRDSCYAHCRELSTGERIEGPGVSIAMAKAEGWSDRKGSKWRTMPEVMLTNRAAAFLIRTTAPELSLGLPMRDEAEDIVEVNAREIAEAPSSSPLQTVRDLLRETPARDAPAMSEAEPTEPHVATPPEPEPVAAPAEPSPPEPVADAPTETAMEEPKSLPVKDGELTPQDAQRKSRPRPAPPPAPVFNADAYARRIKAIADVDLLTLMREEIVSLPPSSERDELMQLIDSKTHELIPEGNDHDHT